VKGRFREALVLGLLGALPLAAFAPALRQGRLLGPGEATAFHYPQRLAAWESWPEPPSWNPSIFGGTVLLASYPVGALYPPTLAAALLEPFLAFNVLVLVSLALAGVLTFLYLRALGAGTLGSFVAGLSFSLGPYLVDHLEDTATIVASPTLPLLLWAAEAHLRRSSLAKAALLAGALALLLLAGSREALGAGGILLGLRLLLGHSSAASRARPSFLLTGGALLSGVLLAAPQLLPTLLALPAAGKGSLGLGASHRVVLPGLTGRILRYVSHTPAPALALSTLPLALESAPVRIFQAALALVLGLQWGRGPLAAPGALSMAFDFCLAVLAGLSLSAQWKRRLEKGGRRLRAYFLFAAIASAGALSVSAAALGPLPEELAPAVGILALSLILYFSLGASPEPVRAGVFLLPLTVSFLLQPGAREVWDTAPTRNDLVQGTPTAQSIGKAMGPRAGRRALALVRSWPRLEAADLAYGNLSLPMGRRSANGYDPMVPARTRRGLGGMSSAGLLPGAFFRTDPTRLDLLGILWVEVPTTALTTRADTSGLGDTLDITLAPARPRFFPLPITPATEVRIASHLSGAIDVGDDQPIARVRVRLASGRDLELLVRAGRDTSEWAYDRPDVRPVVRHQKARVLESISDSKGGFEGHRYLGILPLRGRYLVEGLEVERLPGPGEFTLSRLGLMDLRTGSTAPLSLAAGYVSDEAHFREAFATPSVRLFELPQSLGPARVTETLRVLESDEAVLHAVDFPELSGFDPRREALATARDARGFALPPGGVASRAEVTRNRGGRVAVEAAGPGLLVLAESFDPGWSARVDSQEAPILRVNHVQMGVALPPGSHFVEFRHHARGLRMGMGLALCPLVGFLLLSLRRGR
jgi:hypothetical protein